MEKPLKNFLVSLFLGALSSGCGGGSGTPVLSVGGTYQTLVTLLPGGTCGNVMVQNNPTTVTHTPGAQTLSITHVSINATGTIDSTAHFSTNPTTVSSFTVTITGQFTVRGFDATVTLTQAQPACQYMVHWVGTKDGAPNTIP
jgi:hypothetical protein